MEYKSTSFVHNTIWLFVFDSHQNKETMMKNHYLTSEFPISSKFKYFIKWCSNEKIKNKKVLYIIQYLLCELDRFSLV